MTKHVLKGGPFQRLIKDLHELRAANGKLAFYDWINTPLRYIQITTFATYAYFLVGLVGNQCVRRENGHFGVDMYLPIVFIMQFIFYIGWLKVAESNRSVRKNLVI